MKTSSKFLFAIILSLLVFTFSVTAQKKEKSVKEKPDPSGTWVLDEKDRKVYGNQIWVITSITDELRIKKTQDFDKGPETWELVLFTDGRGEKNLLRGSKGKELEVESKTYWVKNSIVRKFTGVSTNDLLQKTYVTETYSMSVDGKQLILLISRCDSHIFPTNADQEKLLCSEEKRVFKRDI